MSARGSSMLSPRRSSGVHRHPTTVTLPSFGSLRLAIRQVRPGNPPQLSARAGRQLMVHPAVNYQIGPPAGLLSVNDAREVDTAFSYYVATKLDDNPSFGKRAGSFR